MTTNSNNNSQNGSPLASIIVVALLVGLAVALIVFLKNATNRDLDSDGYFKTASDSTIAEPDLDKESKNSGIIEASLPDTIMGTDARDVADAGYEDGYWAGYDDAHLGQERASYDESCTFPTAADRAKYARNYREGYQEGWQTGQADREAANKQDDSAQ